MTANEVCAYLRISKKTINGMVKKGLKCSRINTRGDRRFKKSDIDQYLKETNEST